MFEQWGAASLQEHYAMQKCHYSDNPIAIDDVAALWIEIFYWKLRCGCFRCPGMSGKSTWKKVTLMGCLAMQNWNGI
jgi:hypothetical protein